MFDVKKEVAEAPLYREVFEHDNCGIGACVNIKGQKSRETVENALKIVENLEHRAGRFCKRITAPRRKTSACCKFSTPPKTPTPFLPPGPVW